MQSATTARGVPAHSAIPACCSTSPAAARTSAFPASHRVLELPPRPPDVLHLHNLHGGYFDLRVLPELSARQPTVVTMHDEWLYTGHCAYTLDSERWLRVADRARIWIAIPRCA